MAFERYVKLQGSERQPLAGATKAGAPSPEEPMQVTVVLRPQRGGDPASQGGG